MRAFQLSALVLGASLLGGCPEEEFPACTAEARASVQVELLDVDDGAPIADATLTYSADGAAPQPCDELGAAGEYVCGYEVNGELVIEVAAAGYEDEAVTVQVESDECHVMTEQVVVELTPLAEG